MVQLLRDQQSCYSLSKRNRNHEALASLPRDRRGDCCCGVGIDWRAAAITSGLARRASRRSPLGNLNPAHAPCLLSGDGRRRARISDRDHHRRSSSRRNVSFRKPAGLLGNDPEFAERPGAHRLDPMHGAARGRSHSDRDRVRSIRLLRNDHHVMRSRRHIGGEQLAALPFRPSPGSPRCDWSACRRCP